MIEILDQQLKDAGIPIVSVRLNDGVYSIQYDDAATKDQKAQGDQMAATFNPQTYLDAKAAEIQAVQAIAAKADDDTPVTAAEIRAFMARVSKEFGWIK